MKNTALKPKFDLTNFNISDAIRKEADNLSVEENQELLTVLSANNWMARAKSKPIPQMLFDCFWHEDEVCIFYADTNLGKSILAVQIADSISRGIGIPGFRLGAAAQRVVYYDFELSEKQFENRYSINYERPYHFHENFFRAELNPNADLPDSYENFNDLLIDSIESSVKKTGARVLIIDNITYLINDPEKARHAGPLMKQLKRLKNQYDLSLLVLAHTPKRDSSKPLTQNDLLGSKMFSNFCDSCFAIGRSHLDERLRYIKQIKQRSTEQLYGEDNVCLLEIEKPDNFLRFKLRGYAKEWEHLKQPSEDDRKGKIEEVKKLHQQGLTQRQIAEKLSISLGCVNNYLNSSKN